MIFFIYIIIQIWKFSPLPFFLVIPNFDCPNKCSYPSSVQAVYKEPNRYYLYEIETPKLTKHPGTIDAFLFIKKIMEQIEYFDLFNPDVAQKKKLTRNLT